MEDYNLQSLVLDTGNSDSVENKLKQVLSIVRRHLGMEVAFISEFINGERVFKFVDVKSTDSVISAGDSDPLEETYCQRIVRSELANIIHDTAANSITNKLDVTDKLSIGSYMGVPIMLSSGDVYGTFCCYKNSSDETLNERDLYFLSAIAEIASVLIEKHIEAEIRYREVIGRVQSVLDMDQFDIHYQPIYSLDTNQVSGFESLSRFVTEPYMPPNVWFDEASQVGLGESLEIMAIEKALKGLDELASEIYISINVSPEYVWNGALSKVLTSIDTARIVVEITEHSHVKDYADLRRELAPLRERGIRLAIDDAGAGYSSFQHILELEADIIKLDISLTKGIDHEPKKYLLAKAICAFAKAIKCIVIAEGIETIEELNVLRELGVDKVQGYLLGRPMSIKEACNIKKGI